VGQLLNLKEKKTKLLKDLAVEEQKENKRNESVELAKEVIELEKKT